MKTCRCSVYRCGWFITLPNSRLKQAREMEESGWTVYKGTYMYIVPGQGPCIPRESVLQCLHYESDHHHSSRPHTPTLAG